MDACGEGTFAVFGSGIRMFTGHAPSMLNPYFSILLKRVYRWMPKASAVRSR
jgi:hypothetical protein